MLTNAKTQTDGECCRSVASLHHLRAGDTRPIRTHALSAGDNITTCAKTLSRAQGLPESVPNRELLGRLRLRQGNEFLHDRYHSKRRHRCAAPVQTSLRRTCVRRTRASRCLRRTGTTIKQCLASCGAHKTASPSPPKIYACDSTTYKCVNVSAGTHGGASEQVCNKTCAKPLAKVGTPP